MAQSGKNFIKKILGSKIFLFLVILALITVAVNVGRESYRKYQLTQEINRLKLEIERIEGKNKQLANLMEYLKQEPYLEKEARLKLNLKKPGEKVVILSDWSDKEISSEASEKGNSFNNQEAKILTQPQKKEIANYWKWWEYFFAP
jgi:cell division protein FtsB